MKRKKMTKDMKIIIFLLIMIFIIFSALFILKIVDKEDSPELPSDTIPVTDVDSVDPKELLISQLKQEKHYIPSNLERYLEYNDGVKSTKEIVTEVNCNLDNPKSKQADVSKGNLILVNKYNYLDSTFEPTNKIKLVPNVETTWTINSAYLSQDAYDAFIKILSDSKKMGFNLIDASAYRSYDFQTSLYNESIWLYGQDYADKYTAKPGLSEHQTGLATDFQIVGYDQNIYTFVQSEEYKWLKDNAHKYGFILRYPEGKEKLTGYSFEAWHYRYVGVDVATYIYENDIVFEEYYAYFCEYKKSC